MKEIQPHTVNKIQSILTFKLVVHMDTTLFSGLENLVFRKLLRFWSNTRHAVNSERASYTFQELHELFFLIFGSRDPRQLVVTAHFNISRAGASRVAQT